MSRVVLRSDGDPTLAFRPSPRASTSIFAAESHLFGIENGGAVIERMLELFLEHPTPYLFKIDPDTAIHRCFQYLPDRGGLFGTPQGEKDTPSIQGGCMGFTLDAAERILKSEMLRDDRLRGPAEFIDDSPYFVRMAHRADSPRTGKLRLDRGLDRDRIGNSHGSVRRSQQRLAPAASESRSPLRGDPSPLRFLVKSKGFAPASIGRSRVPNAARSPPDRHLRRGLPLADHRLPSRSASSSFSRRCDEVPNSLLGSPGSWPRQLRHVPTRTPGSSWLALRSRARGPTTSGFSTR